MNILATFEFTKFFLIAPSGGYTCKTPCMPLSFVYSWGGGDTSSSLLQFKKNTRENNLKS